ncbi:methyltransferase small domain-containing protein [Ditylenchus destructor]|uniref:Methyltransferase HEMK2 n=1 Tax=Ditylenchus destructor TaxID=166010 RepID=A0AAD4N182_9BILA|nr:methyltransferase small domain-containing protein [Ditylenchus destructor]
MLPTPNYKLNALDVEKSVYPPSEDTFLLLDALEADKDELRELRPTISIEIGSGSGVVTAFLRQMLSDIPLFFSFCTDLNRQALKCTKRTGEMNSLDFSLVDTVQCDLLEAFNVDRLSGKIDLILFNPPYVPSTDEEIGPTTSECNEDSLYYAGGHNGRRVMERILSKVQDWLSPGGAFYLVALKENDVHDILRNYSNALKGTIALERRCGIEHLFVLKFIRRPDNSIE